jgi:integrase
MATAQRLRTYLTRDEVTLLLRAAKKSRHGARNHAMILLAYRHGLRASELVGLRWSDVDLERATIYCRRAKGSRSTVHPLKSDEVAAIERLQRKSAGDYVFVSERGERMSRSAFWRVVAQAGERACLPVKAYAHLLRYSCGYYLANKGCDLRLIQDYLGHKQIHYVPRRTMSR